MKKRLGAAETLSVASMLFGMFFGAGNLIFPAYLGQAAGKNLLPALGGFLITGVGLPMLAVIAFCVVHADGVMQLGKRVGKGYGYFFTCALYLTIGPFFAIPRCFTVPFETGALPLLPDGADRHTALFIFSLVFFALMLYFSLRPGGILIWVGKLLNPIFLIMLMVILINAILNPIGSASGIEPAEGYTNAVLVKGILEGYNTMDALAGLAFGIVVVNVVSSLGLKEPDDIAASTVRAGVLACLAMGLIYGLTALVGAQSRAGFPLAANGGEALSVIVGHYFPGTGSILFAAMIYVACLKTATGLITSCSEAFVQMFPDSLSYRKWAVGFSVISFMIANIGLSGIISFSIPVLMMLYPLSITLILLVLSERYLHTGAVSYRMVTAVTLVCAIGDMLAALPEGIRGLPVFAGIISGFKHILPFYGIGLGWVLPAAAAFAIAVIVEKSRNKGINGENI